MQHAEALLQPCFQRDDGALVPLVKAFRENLVPARRLFIGNALKLVRVAGSNDDGGACLGKRGGQAATKQACGACEENGVIFERETGWT